MALRALEIHKVRYLSVYNVNMFGLLQGKLGVLMVPFV